MDLFVDLSNIYSHLIKSKLGGPKLIRDYFVNWLDFDLLANAIVAKLGESVRNIWIFYSGHKIGPSTARISGKYLEKYIERLNITTGITARDVNIPGEQREKIIYKCEKCGTNCDGEWITEKGVDAALTVHLFETMESWDNALLLSCDADFVPTVASLRRRGKIVNGAGFSNASPALKRECYKYYDLRKIFFVKDLISYRFFNKDGIIKKLFSIDEINYELRDGEKSASSIRRLTFTSNLSKFILSISKDYDITFLKSELEDINSKLKKRIEIEPMLDPYPSEGGQRNLNSVTLKRTDFFEKSVTRRFSKLASFLERIEGIKKVAPMAKGGHASYFLLK